MANGQVIDEQNDPEAAAAVPFINIEVPVYEYDCNPILSGVSA